MKFLLALYLGSWFEIARIPNSFQDNTPGGYGACYNTSAEYAVREDGRLSVTNTCDRRDEAGRVKHDVARAVARPAREGDFTKLKVNFTGIKLLRWLGIGDGDYWILGVGPVENETYTWALVGSPTRKYGWILSRTPTLPADTLEAIYQLAEREGYDRTVFKSN
jgi:apolipoprotein D and lipocalin family protein